MPFHDDPLFEGNSEMLWTLSVGNDGNRERKTELWKTRRESLTSDARTIRDFFVNQHFVWSFVVTISI